jgi:intein/homing endonuclease
VLEIAKVYIKERHGKTVDYLKLPLEDKDVMEAFGRGDTTGVFQFESCLAGDSVVDGFTIKERFDRQTVGEEIRTLDESRHDVTPGIISKIVYSGKKKVYSLKLKNGKTIKATADHRFYKNGEWVKLSDLLPGDKLLTVRTDYVECEERKRRRD